MSKLPKKTRDKQYKTIGDHKKFITRITKTLYYGKFPTRNEGLSLPVTELATELFSEAQRGRSLDRLHCDDAAKISRSACVSPCSLVLAILYLERLKKLNPEYLEKTAPSDLFLVSLMISCKFLYDDGEADEVFMDEWAASGGMTTKQMVQLEKQFLKAIGWEIFVNELSFLAKLSEIEKSVAQRQGSNRGFFTYTELTHLLSALELHALVQNIAAFSTLLLGAYTMAVLTLLGSVFIVSHIPGASLQPRKIDNQTLSSPPRDLIKTDFVPRGVDVVQTGILLASIETMLSTPYCDNYTRNATEGATAVTWDWWTVPTMQWLSSACTQIGGFVRVVPTFAYYLDAYVSKVKHLELEDYMHKATKTRIQDQMENSWHVEWTDVVRRQVYVNVK